MTTQAIGTFDVKITPQPDAEGGAGSTLGRMTLEKTFHGDIDATSRGQMLTAMSEVKGSAGYVAVERVEGSVHGRSGSFALLHRGIMTRGAQQLELTIVPDSGSGDLVGIAGTMSIEIVDGAHKYALDYTLPAATAARE
jgi:hypothetical protein